jgi:hypothetical protein
MTLATISYLCPLAMVTKKPMHVITTLYVTTLITLVAVLTTSLGEQNGTSLIFSPRHPSCNAVISVFFCKIDREIREPGENKRKPTLVMVSN